MIARFANYTFDSRRRQVVRDNGDVLHLTPKAFDLLRILLDEAPSVVRKGELHERLWTGTFVSDATLVGLVKELRRALSDHDSGSPLIRTAYGVGYAFCGAVDRTRSAAPAGTPRSIAVLPFANLSAEPENEYFSDGLSEELITALTQLPGMRVASRTSAFQFRNRNDDIKEIGRQLDVDQVLEGSVRRAGTTLRITARLVNVADGYPLWSARYDRHAEDVFAIHDEITASIVRALEPTLTGRPKPAAARHTNNVEAFDLYLKGRHNWHQRTPESLQTGIAHFEAAIRLDPDYALALAGLADSYSGLAFYGYLPLEDARAAAGAAARRAVELAPERPESHYAMALFAIWLSPEWTQAEGSFRKALEIQPDFAPAHTHYSAFLASRNRLDEARTHILEAMTLDPLSPAVHATGALSMFVSRKYDDARRFGERSLELHSSFAVGLYALGLTHCRTGEFDKAIDAFEQLLSLSRRAAYFVGWAALAHGLAGRRSEARALASDVAKQHSRAYVHPLTPVLIAVALEDRTAAAEALRSYVAKNGSGFQVAHVAPFLDGWMAEHPFVELLDRLHLAVDPR